MAKRSKKQKSSIIQGHTNELICSCGRIVSNCSNDAVSVKCWRCVSRAVGAPEVIQVKEKSDKPRGWKFMKVYVHKDGTVYHKGIEQPELKGTLPMTVIIKKPKKDKSKTAEEQVRIGKEINSLKKQLKSELNPKSKKQISKQIEKLNKKLSKLL